MYFSRVIYLTVYDINLLSVLKEVATGYKDSVILKSCLLSDDARIENAVAKISIDSTSITDCLEAEDILLVKIPCHWIMFPKQTSPNFEFIQQLTALDLEISEVLKTSFQIIEEFFSVYDISETFVCFNGGKDCTVLLHLVYCFYLTKNFCKPLKLVYFEDPDSFSEVNSFIGDIKDKYRVDMQTLHMPMKNSLINLLKKEPQLKACFLGLRHSDPKTENLKPIQETDPDWPKLMRSFPILHWSYKNVWDFIRCANIPYCSLYNEGYTSLGNRSNTVRNPALKFINEDGSVSYKPAFLLHENNCEREGRHFKGST